MAAIPTKLFDVRTGNDAVDKDSTPYPAATLLVFRDAAAKTKLIQSFCDFYGYPVTIVDEAGQTIPNPQSKQAFFNAKLTDYLKEIHRGHKTQVAVQLAAATARTDADAELP